jgi:hypothetical protein
MWTDLRVVQSRSRPSIVSVRFAYPVTLKLYPIAQTALGPAAAALALDSRPGAYGRWARRCRDLGGHKGCAG